MNLSVCCITYNHGLFIQQAMESFLAQKTGFDFEVIVSDDCSTDETAHRVEVFASQHPGKIKLYKHARNLGMMPNFKFALNACSGKYIAICEGDDYWLDANKLQKQVDFLEANADYAICFHGVYEQEGKHKIKSHHNISDKEETKTIADLARYNFISTPSVVFRNKLTPQFPDWFETSPVGDYVLHMLNARHGKIKYFPELMAVYRKHGGSTWSKESQRKMSDKWVKVLDLLLQEQFPYDAMAELKSQRRYTLNTILKTILEEDNEAVFLEQLKTISQKDPMIKEDWLTDFYPRHIRELKSGGAYRLAQKLVRLKKAILRK